MNIPDAPQVYDPRATAISILTEVQRMRDRDGADITIDAAVHIAQVHAILDVADAIRSLQPPEDKQPPPDEPEENHVWVVGDHVAIINPPVHEWFGEWEIESIDNGTARLVRATSQGPRSVIVALTELRLVRQ